MQMDRKDFLRILGTMGAATAAGGLLSGCGVPMSTGGDVKSKASGTVKFWHVWGEARLKLIDEQIAEFQELYPDIKVEHTLLAQKGMQEKYLTAIAGGSPPDLLMIRRSEVPAFVENNAVVALDSYATADKLDMNKIFYESEVKTSYVNNRLYSMPHATGAGLFMMFNNNSVFSSGGLDPTKAPKTLKQLEEMSLAMTRKDSAGKLTQMGFNILTSGFAEFLPFVMWLYANGGSWLSDDASKVTFNSTEGLETLEWMISYLDKHGGMDALNQFVGTAQGTNRTAFFNGKLGMLNEGVFFFLQLQETAPTMQYSVSELPFNDVRLKNSIGYVEGGWGLSIPKGAKNQDAAWEFAKFFSSGEGLCNFFAAQARPAPQLKCNENPVVSTSNPHWPVVDQVLKHGLAVPISTAHLKIRAIVTQMTEEALFKKKSAKDALAWGTAEVQKELDAAAAKKRS